MKEQEDLELVARKWKHRRRMAYVSLYAVIGLLLLVLLLAVSGHAGNLKDFNSIIVTALGGFFTIIAAYFGVSTWYDVQ